jgi:transposase
VLVALLSGQYRLSKRLLRQLLADVLGVEVALGSISNLEGQLSTALAGAVEQASEYVRDELEERRVGGRDCRWPSPHG